MRILVSGVRIGGNAIIELSANHYDLVTTDLKLPHIDGLEVAATVKLTVSLKNLLI